MSSVQHGVQHDGHKKKTSSSDIKAVRNVDQLGKFISTRSDYIVQYSGQLWLIFQVLTRLHTAVESEEYRSEIPMWGRQCGDCGIHLYSAIA